MHRVVEGKGSPRITSKVLVDRTRVKPSPEPYELFLYVLVLGHQDLFRRIVLGVCKCETKKCPRDS